MTDRDKIFPALPLTRGTLIEMGYNETLVDRLTDEIMTTVANRISFKLDDVFRGEIVNVLEELCIDLSIDISEVGVKNVEGEKVMIPCREVYVSELAEEVMVTTTAAYGENMLGEDSPADNMFYCYVSEEVFYKMPADEFEEYINENF